MSHALHKHVYCWCYGFFLVSHELQALACLHTHLTIDLFPWYNGNCNLLQKGGFRFLCAACSNETGRITGFIHTLVSILFLNVSLLLFFCYNNRSWSCVFSCITTSWTRNMIIWEQWFWQDGPKAALQVGFQSIYIFVGRLCRSML